MRPSQTHVQSNTRDSVQVDIYIHYNTGEVTELSTNKQHTLSHYNTIVDLAQTSVFRVYIFKVTRVKHSYGLTGVHQKGGYTEPPS